MKDRDKIYELVNMIVDLKKKCMRETCVHLPKCPYMGLEPGIGCDVCHEIWIKDYKTKLLEKYLGE